MDIEYILKIYTIGDESTGKTSIIKKFINDDFNNDYNLTVGVDINSIKIQ
jgi:GTPase SAR1 family protein